MFDISVGTFLKSLGKFAYIVFFIPFALVLGAIVIFDVVAVAYFFYDLFNTLVRIKRNATCIFNNLVREGNNRRVLFTFNPTIIPLQTMDAFIRHLELENTSTTLYVPFLINENLLPVPSIILLCVAGRGFIFWCLNVIFIHVILAKGKQILWGPRRSGSPLATSSFGFEQNSHNGNTVLEVGINKPFPVQKQKTKPINNRN